MRALLADDPELPATVIAEPVGWEGSITWFRENVKRLRPAHRKIDPADRLSWAPGDAAQCDLGGDASIAARSASSRSTGAAPVVRTTRAFARSTQSVNWALKSAGEQLFG